MLISETTKMTSSVKPKNPCQENPAKDYLNYSTLIPTGRNYNIPPKYMIYECTLVVLYSRFALNILAVFPLYGHLDFLFYSFHFGQIKKIEIREFMLLLRGFPNIIIKVKEYLLLLDFY